MTLLERIACDACGCRFPDGPGGRRYVRKGKRRVTLADPGGPGETEAIVGMDWFQARGEGLTGFSSHCMCFDCCARFERDLDRDPKVCPQCVSTRVASAHGAIGRSCPKCGCGRFRVKSFGVA